MPAACTKNTIHVNLYRFTSIFYFARSLQEISSCRWDDCLGFLWYEFQVVQLLRFDYNLLCALPSVLCVLLILFKPQLVRCTLGATACHGAIEMDWCKTLDNLSLHLIQ